MHLKALKPLRGWRAFLGEVGVVVLGVLLALGAQQLVQDVQMRWHQADHATVQNTGASDQWRATANTSPHAVAFRTRRSCGTRRPRTAELADRSRGRQVQRQPRPGDRP